jgi:hypothetical protein
MHPERDLVDFPGLPRPVSQAAWRCFRRCLVRSKETPNVVYLVVDGAVSPVLETRSELPYYIAEPDASAEDTAATICRVRNGRRLCGCGQEI